MTSAPSGDRTVETAYEQLRRSVFDSTFGAHFGRVLMMREGIAAWMAHGATCTAAPCVRDAEPPKASLAFDPFNAGVVQVLASMALAQNEGRKTA